jgi:hypothetical protein
MSWSLVLGGHDGTDAQLASREAAGLSKRKRGDEEGRKWDEGEITR